jgi:transketolase (EC 2.2.1.1)
LENEEQIYAINGLVYLMIIGMNTFGASAPLKELQKKFGFTPDQVAAADKEQIRKNKK